MLGEQSRVRSKRRGVSGKDEAGVGVLALGSHDERHGAILPPDTDAKLAAHIALEAAKRTGAKFIGILLSSHELPFIDTGEHHPIAEVLSELRGKLKEAKRVLGLRAVVLVNAHGGNKPLRKHLRRLERESGLKLAFNTRIVDVEGPHAGTGEVSAGVVVGIGDPTKLREHTNFEKYPEVGFVGFKRAREVYPWAEEHAREVSERGIHVDEELGRRLVEEAIESVVRDIRRLKSFRGSK